jgi:NAD(P)-dependent dehydrogenase (short-subunit alcohol dehydrogenase family)
MGNRTVLITGGSRGIGAATARLFAEKGYDLCINYKANDDAAKALQTELEANNIKCILVKADVSLEADVKRLFDIVDNELGYLDVLVNNAGILMKQSRFIDLSVDRFAHVMNVNVLSCFLCSKEAVSRMSIKHGGHGGTIVNVSSGASKSGSPNEYIDYAASKGAMDTMTRGLALEVADEGIRVNAVRPGLIYTDIHADGGEPGRVDRLAERIPLKRGGKPEEVAESIYWLASDASSFVTGSFIDPSGGL